MILLDAEQGSGEFLHPLVERIAAARGVPQRGDFRGEISKGLVENRIEDVSLGWLVLVGIVVELALLILLMQTPLLQRVFGVTAIHPYR